MVFVKCNNCESTHMPNYECECEYEYEKAVTANTSLTISAVAGISR